jgi:indole-3-glycerol phosphate synthase
VLADERYFGGSIDLLRTVSRISTVPTLCKDFVVDPYQCFEARDAGATAILLIVKILSDRLLRDLHEAARKLGLTAVVEVQTEEELRRAVHIDPSVILINNRNLDTFVISLETTEKLALQVPDGPIVISASGINAAADIAKLLPFSTTFLIGSALMQSQNMEALLSELVSADLKCTEQVNG